MLSLTANKESLSLSAIISADLFPLEPQETIMAAKAAAITLNSWNKSLSVVFAIANNKVLRKLSSLISNTNVQFPNIIAPNIVIKDVETFKIGKGNIIQGGCVVINYDGQEAYVSSQYIEKKASESEPSSEEDAESASGTDAAEVQGTGIF